MGLYNDLPLIQTLYLVPFARYSASKIPVSDLDLSESPKVKYFQIFLEADMQLYNGFPLIQTLYLVPFARYSSYFWRPCRKSNIWPSQSHWPQLILCFNRPPVSPYQCAPNEIYCVYVRFTVWSVHSFIQQKVLKYWIVPEITWENFRNIFQIWGFISPEPFDRINPVSGLWNSIYSSICVRKSAWLLDIFYQLCDGQRTPMFRKNKNKTIQTIQTIEKKEFSPFGACRSSRISQ